MVDVPIHEEKEQQRGGAGPRVQFPDGPTKSSPPMSYPYPYSRQDSDATTSIATDDDDSNHYDWSDEEDLVDEEAKFLGQMGQKTKKNGWGFKRLVDIPAPSYFATGSC